ncbi:MAG: HAD hydrolase family protein [Pseudomonadota bacterium]
MNVNLQQRAAAIRLLLLDVDGVLTDGRLPYSALEDACELEESKSFHVRDGLGLNLLQKGGVDIGIITARSSLAVSRRMRNLGIQHVHQGQHDKLLALENILQQTGLEAAQVAYMGDDLIDLPVLRRVGLAATVLDADDLIKSHCHFVSGKMGGMGAVREICELLLKAQGKWEGILAHYLR